MRARSVTKGLGKYSRPGDRHVRDCLNPAASHPYLQQLRHLSGPGVVWPRKRVACESRFAGGYRLLKQVSKASN